MLQTSVRGEWDVAQEEITTKKKKKEYLKIYFYKSLTKN